MWSNISASPVYGVHICQLIRYVPHTWLDVIFMAVLVITKRSVRRKANIHKTIMAIIIHIKTEISEALDTLIGKTMDNRHIHRGFNKTMFRDARLSRTWVDNLLRNKRDTPRKTRPRTPHHLNTVQVPINKIARYFSTH